MPARILIADDNSLVRSAMRQVLETAGRWEVLEAVNGEEAIAKAQEAKPDLIVLDLAMPQLDGMSAARRLRQLLPNVPILMHTLYWSPRIEVEALKIGVRKIVPKSESNAIVSAVLELLRPEPAATDAMPPPAQTPAASFPPKIMVLQVERTPADNEPQNIQRVKRE
jgi:two-component system chemotaxis response regulator CheY